MTADTAKALAGIIGYVPIAFGIILPFITPVSVLLIICSATAIVMGVGYQVYIARCKRRDQEWLQANGYGSI